MKGFFTIILACVSLGLIWLGAQCIAARNQPPEFRASVDESGPPPAPGEKLKLPDTKEFQDFKNTGTDMIVLVLGDCESCSAGSLDSTSFPSSPAVPVFVFMSGNFSTFPDRLLNGSKSYVMVQDKEQKMLPLSLYSRAPQALRVAASGTILAVQPDPTKIPDFLEVGG